jgi:hypothetical protein
MRELLTSGAVGSIEYDAQKKIREDIQNRWDKLGFLNGLSGHIKENMGTLYENQAKHLIYEATASDNSGSFETVVFPLIRRVFSKLLANDIVSVQAMNLPVGKLFYIRPVTSERHWDYDEMVDGNQGSHTGLMGYKRTNRFYDKNADEPTGTWPATPLDARHNEQYNRYYLDDTVVDPVQTSSRTTEPEVTTYMKKSLYDLFYDDFLYDNSKGKATIKVGTADVVRLGEDGEFVPVASEEELPLLNGAVASVILEVSGFASYNASRLTGPDGNEMDTEAFLASLKVITKNDIEAVAVEEGSSVKTSAFKKGESVPFRVVTQKYGHGIVNYGDICDAKGKLYIELDLTKPCTAQGGTIDGYIGVKASALFTNGSPNTDNATDGSQLFDIAWIQYDSLELETEMGEVSFELTSVTVAVEERKLRATWSPELAQDVSAFHNIDAEAELTAILSEQIAAELDREILRDLRKAAPWQARWDYNGWQRLGTTSTVYTQKDWNQTLMTKINMISAQIQKSTLQGGANFIVVSAEISAVLNDLEYFHVTDASAESEQYNMGIEKIGSLQGRYKVIVDPYAPYWSLIMGHHGTSLLDTGYIYAPYIPMALTPTVTNPFNFAPVKGIMTRYAKKLVNNRYYGAIRCDGLVHWSTLELR